LTTLDLRDDPPDIERRGIGEGKHHDAVVIPLDDGDQPVQLVVVQHRQNIHHRQRRNPHQVARPR